MSVKKYRVRLQAHIEASSPEAAARVLLHKIQSESTWARVWEVHERCGPSLEPTTVITIHEGQVIDSRKENRRR